MLAVDGMRIYEADTDTTIRIKGVNENMVVSYAMYYHKRGFTAYKDQNYNFPTNYDNPEIYPELDPSIDVWSNVFPHMSSTTDREFLWKYFWLAGNYLHLNCVRVNDGGYTNHQENYEWWAANRNQYIQYLTDMFDMAYANGIYIVFCFLGAYYDGTIDPAVTNHILVPDSVIYNQYWDWIEDVILTFKDHPGVGMWDLYNEPDSTVMSTYWIAKGGGTVVGGRTAMLAYLNRLCSDAIAIDHSHPLSIGVGAVGTTLGSYTHLEYSNPSGADIWSTHPYYSYYPLDNANITSPHNSAKSYGKALLIGEIGYNGTTVYHPPYSYWKDLDDAIPGWESGDYVDGICWMTLNEMRVDQGAAHAQVAYSYPSISPTAFYPIPNAVYYAIPAMPLGGESRRTSPTGAAYGGIAFY